AIGQYLADKIIPRISNAKKKLSRQWAFHSPRQYDLNSPWPLTQISQKLTMTANPNRLVVESTTAKRTPTFLIIGVQKAGTTSIYMYLKQHPQVYMSPVKETNFFERDWAQSPADVQRRKKNGIITWDDYQQLFDGATDTHLAIGEASPNYMFHHQFAAEQIQTRLPDAKLIAILRNPVQRAFSDYLMHMRDAVGKQTPLAEQVRSRGSTSHVLLKGKYYESLKHFMDVFGRSRVDVFFYDDL
ncbi:MAG: sulfotransferase, partial [Cyanobacteria bacterium J06636_28]